MVTRFTKEAEELLREIRERKRLKGKGSGRSDPTEIGGCEPPKLLQRQDTADRLQSVMFTVYIQLR